MNLKPMLSLRKDIIISHAMPLFFNSITNRTLIQQEYHQRGSLTVALHESRSFSLRE